MRSRQPPAVATFAALGLLILAASSRADLPAALAAALACRDPELLADSTLPRLADLSESDRVALRRTVASWPVPRRVAAFAFLQVGTPYRNGPLGEEAPPDTDPLIRYDVTDCAVLNLLSESLAHADEAGGVRAAMRNANYRGGAVSYATRLHFTTDRLDESPYDTDATRRLARRAGAGRSLRVRRITLNRRRDGSRWIPIEWEREREVVYLSTAAARDLPRWFQRRRLPDAIGVAFVQEAKLAEGLDVVHESLLWKGRTLLHGSSRIGRVVTIDWMDFLRERGRTYDGVVLFEYR